MPALGPRLPGRMVSLLFLVCCAVLSVCRPASVSAAGPAAEADAYRIGIGDVLGVSVWGENDLSRPVTVRLDGRITLPLIGDVPARGRSPQELAGDITGRLKAFIADPNVTVSLTESRSRVYYVLGQILKPGEYSLDTPLTILQALARAGGLAEWAKKDRIKIVRREGDRETILRFNYARIVDGDDLGSNYPVRPGDTIIVP